MPIPIHSTVAPARRQRPVSLARLALAAVAGAVVYLAVLAATPAAASSETIPATPSNITVTWSVGSQDGSSQANAIVYTVTVDDCTNTPSGATSLDRAVILNSATRATDRGKWITIDVTCDNNTGGSPALMFFSDGIFAGPVTQSIANPS